MTVQTFIPGKSLTLTAAAIRHMEKKVQEKPGTAGIHIGVKPSGCSGYMYVMDLVEAAPADEVEMKVSDALTIFIDQDSLPVLQGTELDYVKQGLNATLQFRNPNATSECGCGESFSVTK
jgi:Fe-S cluster assembly protein SufA